MTLNCNGQLIKINTPIVMGILNMTPDSFYDGGKLSTSDVVLQQAEKMLKDGATFLDVGGYSTRPNAKNISVDEELKRVIPVIELLSKQFPRGINFN